MSPAWQITGFIILANVEAEFEFLLTACGVGHVKTVSTEGIYALTLFSREICRERPNRAY